jgi:bifunctional DNase/RNase
MKKNQKQDRIELEITGLNYYGKNNFFTKIFSKKDPSYLLVMANKSDMTKVFKIIIGEFEAQAIAIVLEKLTPSRPLTHDLLKTSIELLSSKVVSVLINRIDNDIFYSLMSFDGKEENIDARTADAIAMALRFECPIYIQKDLFARFSVPA